MVQVCNHRHDDRRWAGRGHDLLNLLSDFKARSRRGPAPVSSWCRSLMRTGPRNMPGVQRSRHLLQVTWNISGRPKWPVGMRNLVSALTLFMAFPATAGPGVAEAASRCWTLPAGFNRDFSVHFDVTFDDGNVSAIKILEFNPRDAEEAVRSAFEAIRRCSPYRGFIGTEQVTMTAQARRAAASQE